MSVVSLASDGTESADCSAARAQDVGVVDGRTTEVFLISQCKGAPVGALDTVVALNQPPELDQMRYSPSKFISKDETATICATMRDPNADPVEFVWNQLDSAECHGPIVTSREQIGDLTTECVAITPKEVGKYWFVVRAYDLLHDESGNLIRFEQWLEQNGYPNKSHDSLEFPLYAGASLSENLQAGVSDD